MTKKHIYFHIGQTKTGSSAQRDRTPDPYFPELDAQLLDHLRTPIQQMNTLLAEGEKLREQPRESGATEDSQPSFCQNDLLNGGRS